MRARVINERLVGPPELDERVAEIERSFGTVGAQSQGAGGRLEALLEPAELAQGAGAAVVEVGVSRPKREAAIEGVERFAEAPRGKEQLAVVAPGDGHVGFELERALVEAQSGLRLAVALENIGAERQRLGEIRSLPKRRVETLRRRLRVAVAP